MPLSHRPSIIHLLSVILLLRPPHAPTSPNSSAAVRLPDAPPSPITRMLSRSSRDEISLSAGVPITRFLHFCSPSESQTLLALVNSSNAHVRLLSPPHIATPHRSAKTPTRPGRILLVEELPFDPIDLEGKDETIARSFLAPSRRAVCIWDLLKLTDPEERLNCKP
ncbi:hypothetical protein B0H14DRAFT_3488696 [Mycena olivaceomarginata]|nr:hypothetical protein B0H14DRAFT_3488696 [Mycena olivaceomarginata]